MNKLWMGVNNLLLSVNAGDLLRNETNIKNDNIEKATSVVEGIGNSSLSVAMTFLVYAAAIGFVIGAVKLMIDAGNPNKVSDAKQAFIWRIIGAVLGFAAISLVIWASSMGAGLIPEA